MKAVTVSTTDTGIIRAPPTSNEIADRAYTAMRRLVEKMADAIDHGSIDSPEIGNPNEGEPPFRWHEEWRHHARQALQQS